MLGSAAMKVQDFSEGAEFKIISSGFEINRKRTPVGVLDQVVNVQIKPGNLSGNREVSWNVVNHSYSYEVQHTQNPKTAASIYANRTNTKQKILIKNLTPGQTYAVQVAAVGSDPKRVWSVEVISCYVS